MKKRRVRSRKWLRYEAGKRAIDAKCKGDAEMYQKELLKLTRRLGV